MDQIRVYTGGAASCNGYLLITGEGTYVAVDAPEGFVDWILSKKPNAKVTDLLITHQHFDHIQDAAKMKKQFGCTIHAGEQYNEDLTLSKVARDSWNSDIEIDPFVVDDVLSKTDCRTAEWGGQLWHIHAVPGHSRDSIVYQLPDREIIFSGDVIFAGSVGRTDLPGGNMNLLIQGISDKVLNQPAMTTIFPGHGPYTTVRQEMLSNPFFA